jgi:two-component system nitrate/nitrite response regulator NarL
VGHDGVVIAVLEFFSGEPINLTDRLARQLVSIGFEVGIFLLPRRGEFSAPLLTPREQEVLQLAAEGQSGRMIAEALYISPSTVKTHFEHIYERLGVSDRPAAVAEALRHGMIS